MQPCRYYILNHNLKNYKRLLYTLLEWPIYKLEYNLCECEENDICRYEQWNDKNHAHSYEIQSK